MCVYCKQFKAKEKSDQAIVMSELINQTCSNQNDARSPTPVESVGSLSISTEPAQSGEVDETLKKEEPSKPAQEASSDTVDQTQSVLEESSKANYLSNSQSEYSCRLRF